MVKFLVQHGDICARGFEIVQTAAEDSPVKI